MSESAAPAGSVCHIEIPAPDIPRLRAFYGEVFGWTFVPMGPAYELFRFPGGGGGFDAAGTVDASATGGVVLVLAVPEVGAALGRIRAAGGTPLTPKTDIGGGHGWCAYFRDPCGNRLGVWSKD